MKKLLIIIFLLIISISLFGEPTSNCKSYAVFRQDTGQLVYSKNKDLKLPMASTTKIMTAMVFIDQGNLSQDIIYTSEAYKTPFGNMHFPIGTKLSPYDALGGMLITSSNDLSTSIALSHSTREEFIHLMNLKAKNLGLYNTHYVNVHGLDAKEHYSTANDLGKLCIYATKNSIFMSLMKPTYTMELILKDKKKKKTINSTFKDFYKFPGACGIKTGTTKNAKHCFAAYVKRGNIPLIVTVLGSPNAIGETKKIVNYTYNNCVEKIVLSPKKDIDFYFGKHKIPARTKEEAKIFVDKNQGKISYKYEVLGKYPILKGEKLGIIRVYDRDRLIAKRTVYSQKFVLCTPKVGFLLTFILIFVFVVILNLYKSLKSKKRKKTTLKPIQIRHKK